MKGLNEERGNSLVLVLLLIFAVTAIGSVISMVASVDLKISGNERKTTESLYSAEAGLSEAVHRLSLANPTIGTVGGWTGNLAISDSRPYDPEWTARIYLTNPADAPPADPSEFHTGTVQDLNGAQINYSKPGGTTDVLTIRHKWVDLDNDGVRDANEIVRYDARKIPLENFTSGFPVEIIAVTGTAGQATRTIEAEVTKLPLTGTTLGALYVDKALTVNGTPAFCGYNHDVATPVDTDPIGCFPWHLAGGHLPGITTTGDEVEILGMASDILGVPAPTDTSSTNPFFDLPGLLGITDSQLQEVLDDAHHTSITNPLNGITYIDGDAVINSDITGQGLIYITGDLTGNGNLDYKGLVYVEGDLLFTGNPWVLGSIVVRGTSDFEFSAGSATVLYSEEALRLFVGQYLPMVQLSWREK